MKKGLVLFVLLSSALFAGPWQKQGVTSGTVNDILYDYARGLYFIATDSGIYQSSDLSNWISQSSQLHDLYVRRMVWTRVSINGDSRSVYAALGYDGIYAYSEGWTTAAWQYANDTGLTGTSGNTLGYRDMNAVAFLKQGGGLYVYASIPGQGIYKRQMDPANYAAPWISNWTKDTDYGSRDLNINALASVMGGNRLAVATGNTAGTTGTIYLKTSSAWSTSSTAAGVGYLSLSGDPGPGNFPGVMAGTLANGVYLSNDSGASFAPLCSLPVTFGPFNQISLFQTSSILAGVGATACEIDRLNPYTCTAAYVPYGNFAGSPNAVLALDASGAVLVGTQGNGLWYFSGTADPGQPRGNAAGSLSSTAIQSENVSDIAVSYSAVRADAPPTLFAASWTDGLYKCFHPDYCTRYFYAPGCTGGVQGTSIALVPGYDEFDAVSYDTGSPPATTVGKKTLYLATADSGLFRSDNGGASWKQLTGVPMPSGSRAPYEVIKVVASPDFNPLTPTSQNDKHLYALTRDAKLLFSQNGGDSWFPAVDLTPGADLVMANDMAISPGYLHTSAGSRILFVGISTGLLKVTLTALSQSPVFTIAMVFPNLTTEPAPNIPVSVLGVALSPLFYNGTDDETNLEKKTVVIATQTMGLWYSTRYGRKDASPTYTTFMQINAGMAFPTSSYISKIAMHPATDTNTADKLLLYLVKHSFAAGVSSGVDQPGLFYLTCAQAGTTCNWTAAIADPTPTCSPAFSNYMISAMAFSPKFDGSTVRDVFAGHSSGGLWRTTYPPMGTDCATAGSGGGSWLPSGGFYNTPERINGLAECPDPASANKTVLAATSDMGVMISFNGGRSFYPWASGLEYAGSTGKKFTLHDAWAVACTDTFDPCTSPLTCPQHRFLAAPSHCTSYDTNGACLSQMPYGIYWNGFGSSSSVGPWTQATLNSASFDAHAVSEIRYCSSGSDLLAADRGFGSLHSPANPASAYGANWVRDNDVHAPTSLSDITCPGGQSGPILTSTDGPQPRGSRGGFIWGAQPGVGAGMALYFTAGAWHDCTGLDPDENWRAVIMLDTGTVLVGSEGVDNASLGIYRNAQGGEACDTWNAANVGIDSSYSKKIVAFAKVSNGVLAAMEAGTGVTPPAGGIFFSDTDSDGWAWVPVTSGMSCTSNYEVVDGTTVYTGSTCDGVYETDVITYAGTPAAYFEALRWQDPWHETRVDFINRSAGLVTSCSWAFGDSAFDGTCSPTHEYAVTGTRTFTVALTGTNGVPLSGTYTTPLELVETLITGITKGGGDTLTVTWAKPSGTHTYVYSLYRDTGAGGSGASLVAGCIPACGPASCSCSFDEPGSTAYYKIVTTW